MSIASLLRRLVRQGLLSYYVIVAALVGKTELLSITLSLRGLSPLLARHLLTGNYEAAERTIVSAFLTSDDRVLEVGASIGFLSLYCIKVLGVQQVALVEANPQVCEILRRNFALNDQSPPELLECAVAAQSGTVSLGINHHAFASSLGRVAGEVRRIEVTSKTLGDIVAEVSFRPTVLVIDVEGAETTIKVADYLAFNKLVVEFHPEIAGFGPTANLVNSLHDGGFKEVGRMGNVGCYVRGPALNE